MDFLKTIKIISIVLVLFLFTGCAQTIAEVKKDENIDKKVVVDGVVVESIKLGTISGYLLQDVNNDTIYVSSTEIPAKSTEVRASGVLKKKPIVGYYIELIKD